MSSSEKELRGVVAQCSFFGSIVLLFVTSYVTNGFSIVPNDLILLASFRVQEIVKIHLPFEAIVPVVLATVSIDLIASLVAGLIADCFAGPCTESALPRNLIRRALLCTIQASRVNKKKRYSLFHDLLVAVTIEEALARFLFLGLIYGALVSRIPSAYHVPVFYVLFAVGNTLWGVLHLDNYEKEDRKLIRILPLVVSGFFLTYIYVRFGFVAVLVAHLGRNAVLDSFDREQRTTVIDTLMTMFWAVLGLISYALLNYEGVNLVDAVQWVQDSPVFALPKWSGQDYFLFLLFITAAVNGVFSVLLYDRPNLREFRPLRRIEVAVSGATGSAMILRVGLNLLFLVTALILFALLGRIIESVPVRILLIALLACARERAHTPSAAARVIWTSIPIVYAQICMLHALGIVYGLAAGMFLCLALTPAHILEMMDD